MSKKIWESNPVFPHDERKELAFAAWAAATEHLRPELFTTGNTKIDEINAIYAAFDPWWKQQIDQCPHIIADKRHGYLSCILPKSHDGDHRVSHHCKGNEAPGETWISPEQLAWRQRRTLEQP